MTILAWQKKNGDEEVKTNFAPTKTFGDDGTESPFGLYLTGFCH